MELNRLQACLLLVLVSGCSSKVDEQLAPVASSAPPSDSTDPNSLVEGEAEIFGLRLPARASVNRRTQLGAAAQIPWQFDRVANYFRERLEAQAIEVGPRNTIFRHAKIKGDTSGDTYNVVIKRTGHTAEVAFRKEVRQSDVPNPDESGPPREGNEIVDDSPPAKGSAPAAISAPPPPPGAP